MWRFDVILTDWFLGVSKNGGLIPKEQSEWWKMVKSRITSYWISVKWLFFSFSGKPMSLGRQEREALVASTPKVGRSPPGRMGTKAGLRSKLVIVELSIQFWETISSMFKGYQHRSWKMPDNQFNQHSNIFQDIPTYSNRPWRPVLSPPKGQFQCLQEIGHRLHHLQKAVSGKGLGTQPWTKLFQNVWRHMKMPKSFFYGNIIQKSHFFHIFSMDQPGWNIQHSSS